MRITRPVMRYPGGKFALAKWVISHFPAHALYVELFGGAASVLMLKPRSKGEIYNDLNAEIVGVFRVLRNKKQATELARLISLTPFARDEYRRAYDACKDPVERARRIIFRSFASHGSDGVTRPSCGFRLERNEHSWALGSDDWAGFDGEIAAFTARITGVTIENRNAITLIKRVDDKDVLFYADPPYVKSTRGPGTVRYPLELSDADHRELADTLRRIKGMAIVSGYESPLYDELYAGWKKVRHAHHAANGKSTTECLWLSPNIRTTMF